MVDRNLKIKFDQHEITGRLTPSFIAKDKSIARVSPVNSSHELPYEYQLNCTASNGTNDPYYYKWTKYRYSLEPLVLKLDYDKYFPYGNSDGEAIYDEETGETLRDPITGNPV